MPPLISRRFLLRTAAGALALPRFGWSAQKVPPLLDHILLGSNHLDGGIAFVEERVGVRAAFGGVHPGRGTQNALLSLGTRRYLEIIAPDPQQAGLDLRGGLGSRLGKLNEPRLVGWAAHPGNLNQVAIRLRQAGVAFEGPQPGSRKRPDGRVLRWKTLTLKDDQGGALPFFIEWSADSVHPSTDAPRGANLVDFNISGPDSAALVRISNMLELDVVIQEGEKPRLSATIAGSNGKVMHVTS